MRHGAFINFNSVQNGVNTSARPIEDKSRSRTHQDDKAELRCGGGGQVRWRLNASTSSCALRGPGLWTEPYSRSWGKTAASRGARSRPSVACVMARLWAAPPARGVYFDSSVRCFVRQTEQDTSSKRASMSIFDSGGIPRLVYCPKRRCQNNREVGIGVFY